MKGLWNPKQSIQNNLETMGVAFDANKVIGQKTMKEKIIQKMKNDNDLEPVFEEEKKATVDSEVVKKLESEVKEMEDNRTSCEYFYWWILEIFIIERSIFQTFWKDEGCAKVVFLGYQYKILAPAIFLQARKDS